MEEDAVKSTTGVECCGKGIVCKPGASETEVSFDLVDTIWPRDGVYEVGRDGNSDEQESLPF